MRRISLSLLLLSQSCGGASSGGGGSTIHHESEFDNGSLTMSGTITLDESIPAGRMVAFGYEKVSPESGSEVSLNIVRTNSRHVLYFEITNLSAGTFYVYLMVDAGGDEAVGNTGDVIGYYGGTVASPATTAGSATAIELTASRSDIDFGVGGP